MSIAVTPLLCVLALLSLPMADDLLTVAESSDYARTASYDDVMQFINELAAGSDLVRVSELGTTVEGRSIPLITIADPPIENAEQARASGKVRFFAFANIHAGEVCGKEALLQLAREIAADPDHEFLRDMILILAPIYNADGNERFGPIAEHRPGQIGPEEVGIRRNAQNLDLNRDYIKLEAPETRALVRFLTEWDPHITVDCHTTNGSFHQYTLTYAAPLNPSGAAEPIAYVRDTILPKVTERLRENTGYETFFYGNFNRDQTVWFTYSAQPRFGGPYRGLRGQMSILSEAYSYASFKDRVVSTREFVREIMNFAGQHDSTIREIHERARTETIERGRNPQPDDVVGVRHRMAALRQPATIKGFEFAGGSTGGRRAKPTDVPKDYPVLFLGRFEPTVNVRRPHAYIIEPGFDDIAEKLREHGVEVRPFTGFDGNTEQYEIVSIERARRPFEGHELLSLEVTSSFKSQPVFEDDAGAAYIVTTAQPLGNLIVYLLEPRSEDGFAAWGLFGDRISEGGFYPITRVRHPRDVLGGTSNKRADDH